MISVIIPVYNGEKFIREAINCVLRQTFQAWELIIVNDGSKDNTAAVLESCCTDPRIRVIHQKNGGVSAARNTAIAAACGSHIALLDADDLWHPNHLEVLAKLIAQYPDAGLIATYAEVEMANGQIIRSCEFFEGKPETLYLPDFFQIYAEDKRAKTYNACSTCFLREAAVRAGGFKVGCKIGEDLALSLWISAYYPTVLTAKVTAVYRKANSVATKDVSFDPDWFFFDEVASILNDPRIPQTKRLNIQRVMDWFQMRRSRHYMIDGRRKEAIKAYRAIHGNRELRKDLFLTRLLLCMPHRLVRKIFAMRWRTQA